MNFKMTGVVFAVVGGLAFGACGSKGGEAGSDTPAAADDSFAKRKASIDAYMAAIEGAGDVDKAIAAGQAWIDANLEGYKANCKVLVADRQDMAKSAGASKSQTPLDEYMNRANKVAGVDPKNPDMAAMKKSGELLKQLNSFFNCDNVLRAQ